MVATDKEMMMMMMETKIAVVRFQRWMMTIRDEINVLWRGGGGECRRGRNWQGEGRERERERGGEMGAALNDDHNTPSFKNYYLSPTPVFKVSTPLTSSEGNSMTFVC